MRTVVLSTVLIAFLTGLAAVASADDIGAVGRVVSLQINTSSADIYLQYFGRVFVRDAGGTIDEYRWGGTSCGSKVLSEDQVAALQRAYDNKRMQIEPVTQPGQGNTVCLVGFTLVQKSDLKLFAP